MRKLAVLLFLAIAALGFSACGAKETARVGVNAEILEINTELKGFVVKSLDENSVLGHRCYINCESYDMYYVYADNETGELQDLSYDDFVVGDKITVDIKSVENTCCISSRVQLITQRK